jgi:hypothetical protein
VGRREIDTYLQNIINDKLTDDPLLPDTDRIVYKIEAKGKQEKPRLQTKVHLQEEGISEGVTEQ